MKSFRPISGSPSTVITYGNRCLWAIGSNNYEEACACQLVLVKYPFSELGLFIPGYVLSLRFSLMRKHSVNQGLLRN